MFEDICTESAVLRLFSGDNSDYSAAYTSYSLSGVGLTASLGNDTDGTEKNELSLYFLDAVSECRNSSGQSVSLPEAGYGDLVVLGSGSAAKEYRVASVKRCTRKGSPLTYTRLRLK